MSAAPIRAARRVLQADPVMANLIKAVGPYRLQLRAEHPPFEALVRAIAHQQLHGVAAERILSRFIEALGDTTSGDADFPLPQQVLDADLEQLRKVGFSYAKIAALKDLANKTITGVVPTPVELQMLSDQQIIERLTAVRGIGRWTVEMMLIFHLRRPDVLPVDDFGVRNGFRLTYGLRAMPTPAALARFGERWAPHRSVAAWYLWRAVELWREGRLPKCVHRPRIALQKRRGRT
jgi:DNA-3-methyladenine glycosylase II